MKPKSTKAVEEPTAYAEIGAYLHKDGGKAKVKAYTSVNKPLQVDASEKTEQIKRLRVEMHVVEDKTVDSNSFYTKSVDAVQVSDSSPASSSGFSESDYPNTNAGESKEKIASILVLVVTIIIISTGLYIATMDDQKQMYDLSVYANKDDLRTLEVRIQGTEDGISQVQTQVNKEKTSSTEDYKTSAKCISVDSEIEDGEKIWYCKDYSGG